jgi:hypothetical protein
MYPSRIFPARFPHSSLISLSFDNDWEKEWYNAYANVNFVIHIQPSSAKLGADKPVYGQ